MQDDAILPKSVNCRCQVLVRREDAAASNDDYFITGTHNRNKAATFWPLKPRCIGGIRGVHKVRFQARSVRTPQLRRGDTNRVWIDTSKCRE
jgi:hypothetical protein